MLNFQNKIILAFALLWGLSIGISSVWLMNYASLPGKPADSPSSLPAHIFKDRITELPTLAVFIHPQCSCSRASLRELAKLVTQTRDRLNIYILFYQPEDRSLEWVKSDLWDAAAEIPGRRLIVINKSVVDQFGVSTSGQALFYDAGGGLIFSGGLTNSRAHEGDNLGRSTIKSYLLKGELPATQSPVFGCSLTFSHTDFTSS